MIDGPLVRGTSIGLSTYVAVGGGRGFLGVKYVGAMAIGGAFDGELVQRAPDVFCAVP